MLTRLFDVEYEENLLIISFKILECTTATNRFVGCRNLPLQHVMCIKFHRIADKLEKGTHTNTQTQQSLR